MSDFNLFEQNQNDVTFNPIQCSEKTLKSLIPQEGYLYFTTDTKRIYLGKNGNMLPMCASSGFYYGIKEIEYDNSGILPDPNVVFYRSEIEGTDYPQVNDLILNKDGCFYRILTIEEDIFNTLRLTLQGTGGGSGGGGTGDITSGFTIQHYENRKSIYFSSEAISANIGFIANGDAENNFITKIECYFSGTDVPFIEESNLSWRFEEVHFIDLINFFDSFGENSKRVTLQVYDKYGSMRSIFYDIYKIALSLSTEIKPLFTADGNNIEYISNLSGGRSLSSKQMIYSFYNENEELVLEQVKDLETIGDISNSIDISELIHGIYELRVQAKGQLNNTTIPSNILKHKVLRFDNQVNTPLFAVQVPEKMEQYVEIELNYLLSYIENNSYIVQILINGIEDNSVTITTNTLQNYSLLFEKIGTYKLTFKIESLGIEYNTNLIIQKYTGELPVINTNREDLDLYLNPRGKRNDATDKTEWKFITAKGEERKAVLEDFYFESINGWLADENGVPCLKLSQGAKLSIPNYFPLRNPNTTNNKGITIELDFKLSGIIDYEKEFIKCITTDKNNIIRGGFSVSGDAIKLYTSNRNGHPTETGVILEPISLDLVEDKRIRVSFVIEPNNRDFPMIYSYLDGKISGAVDYGTATFEDALNKASLEIEAIDGVITLYGIRIYTMALKQDVILNNYQASLPSLEERQKSYLSNLLLENDDISYSAIVSETYDLQIPYVLIRGGYGCAKDFTMNIESVNGSFALPNAKKDYRLIDFEIHYPKTEYFKGYKDYKEICTFDDGSTVINGFGKTPLTGAMMYAQGTSSLEYPVKNLRIKVKSKDNLIKVRPSLEAVNLICLKADYMESSGSHNTGAANYVDDVYKQMADPIATPGQEFLSGREDIKGEIVTSIKGHPCIVFWSPTGKEEDYQYIGKYNLNLDKATPEPFGFRHITDAFVIEANDNYTEEEIKFGYEVDEDGNLVLDDNGKKINSIHCYEFLDNAVDVCNFLPEAGYSYQETWYNLFEQFNDEGVKTGEFYGWTKGFESRFPEDEIGQHQADSLYPLASWINELYNLEDRTEALERFKNEYQCYFDKDFLVTYYIITNVLMMVDSRVKNMMLATWGKEKRTYIGTDGQEHTSFNHIFYPIFYDMDTMLGLDNTGHVAFKYYDEDTNPGMYNGADILYNFVRDALGEEVQKVFNRINQGNMMSLNTVLPYFNMNQANLANEVMYNEDAEYKYINPYRKGYHDDLNDQDVLPGKSLRLYAAQGDRSLMREYILKNRLKLMHGKYQSDTFLGKSDRIDFRVTKSSDLVNPVVPSSGLFEFTGTNIGYTGVRIGANGTPIIKKINKKGEKIAINANIDNAGGTEAYILGASLLSDLGDLSDKYVQNFELPSSELRFKKLKLGNGTKGYDNPKFNAESNISLTGCKYLEDFNLINCKSYTNGLNFNDCQQIKSINLIGSSVGALTLPVGSSLTELRIPVTVDKLELNSQAFLLDEFFTLGSYIYAEGQEHIDQNLGTYQNDFKHLRELTVIDTPINSYNIVKNAVSLEKYNLQNVNWVINNNDIQYVKTLDTTPVEGKTYYYYDNYNYYVYEGAFHSELYEAVELVVNNEIIKIPVLEKLNSLIGKGLSGTLLLTFPEASEKIKVNEYELYERYNSMFPSLVIEFGENIEVTRAYRIRFFNTDMKPIPSGYSPIFETLANGRKTLKELTEDKLPTPTKPSTNDTVYAFSGYWIDIANDHKYAQSQFDSVVPEADMDFIAEYVGNTRYYSLVLKDYDDRTLYENTELQYNQDVSELVPWYVYRIHEGETQRFTFKGWRAKEDTTDNPSLIDLRGEDRFVKKSQLLYAYYLEESISVPMAEDLFMYNEVNINGSVGYSISLAHEKLKEELGGKITLPIRYNNRDIIKIGERAFNSAKNITHMYIPSTILEIAYRAFYDCLELKQINLPDGLIAIGESAFEAASGMFPMNLEINKLPDSISEIGQKAFAFCPKITITSLPKELVSLQSYVFQNCSSVNIKYLGGFVDEGYKLRVIDSNALAGTGSNIPNSTIWIGESVITIARDAFNNAYSGVQTAYFWQPLTEYEVDSYNDLGLHNGITTMQLNDYDKWGDGDQ